MQKGDTGSTCAVGPFFRSTRSRSLSTRRHADCATSLPACRVSLTAQLCLESTHMASNLKVNDRFPDIALPDHQNELKQLSHFTRPSLLDQHLGFLDGYPLILIFYRGFFCPRDQRQMRQLVDFQRELTVNYGKLVAVSADPPLVQAAFRAGLGAQCTFLSDERRAIIKQINILDETEGEYAYRAQPYRLS